MEEMGMQCYIGVKQVFACPEERDGKPGYRVRYDNGFESWSPKDVFEKAYLPIFRPDKLTVEDVDAFINAGEIHSEKFGNKTTLVQAVLPTGFEELAYSSCVDPANYDHELGTSLAVNKIRDSMWKCLGFVLQWAKNGLRP